MNNLAKIFFVLFLLAAPVNAQQYASLPIIGTGVSGDAFRPDVPKGTPYQANIPTDTKGKPNVQFAIVQFPFSVDLSFVKPPGQVIDQAVAQKIVAARDPNIKPVRLPPPSQKPKLTEGLLRFWRWLMPSSAEAVTASDNFTRANGTLITGNWSKSPTGGADLQISSNIVIANTSNDYAEIGIWNASSFSADQFSQITAGLWLPPINNGQLAPVVRAAIATADAYLCNFEVNASTINIIKMVSNSESSIASSALSIAAGDVLRCEVSGTVLTAYVNGVSVLTQSDSALATGRPGLRVAWSAGDAQSDQGASNWSGGDLGGGAVARRHGPIMQ